MAVTRSTAADRTRTEPVVPVAVPAYVRGPEFLWLTASALLIVIGLTLVYLAKTQQAAPVGSRPPLDLRHVDRMEQLLPYLDVYTNGADRQFAAHKIYDFLNDNGSRIPNVGALSRIRMTDREVLNNRRLDAFRKRIDPGMTVDPDATMPLFAPGQLSRLKPLFLVRTIGDYKLQFFLWSAAIFIAFYAVHFFWRARGFAGTWTILPALLAITGIGLILMVALRDPLRDTLMFASFAQGVIAGCLLLAFFSIFDVARLASGFSFVPLLVAIVLSAALILFGTGPGTSDAKVNLFGTQPVELIKILLVFFLAGYFAKRWEFLRELRERRPALAHITKWIEVPRLEYVLPVVVSIFLMLAFFFLQKDLGPALVFSFVFLLLYAVARNRVALAAFGVALLTSGFLFGYFIGHPKTVHDRVQMWLSPWDNTVHGGDQIVHSLWALSSGGPFGFGPGLGEPAMIPAGHTDLILSVLGEEWGFVGVVLVFVLYAVLMLVGLRIAMRAPTDYTFFLALGLTLLIGLQILLIAGGVFDLLPLSGVATPFLSYGRSAMLANFVIFGILLSISARSRDDARTQPFSTAIHYVKIGLTSAALAVIVKAAIVQTVRADAITGSGALIVQADRVRRFQYNPRLMEIARQIPRGSIYDRSGLPIATSNWDALQQFKDRYAQIGIQVDQLNRSDIRYYPLGPSAFHLLGDLRNRANWSATNSSLQERDSAVQLQGYDDRARVVEVKDYVTGKPTYTIRYDYRELLPLLRHKYQPDNAAVRRILDRNRDVHMSIDARLQVAAYQVLRNRLKAERLDRGSVVVLDTANGDLLAAASEPSPVLTADSLTTQANTGALLDRARYGLYPPGSTFKVVTALAALRLNPENHNQTYQCIRLPDGRVGNFVGNSKRPIRDDVKDVNPHGTLNMERALVVSCNAYFAQLAAYKVGSEALLQLASQLGISVANPPTAAKLKQALPQAGYGQGQVVASPFQMARVAATIANNGMMPFGRWVIDETNNRVQPPLQIIAPALAAQIGKDMREVVTTGTGRTLSGAPVPVAGKTGTAELADDPSHAWFIGYAPYGQQATEGARKIAFAVIAENGQYGGTMAAPIAADIVAAAQRLGIFQRGEAEPPPTQQAPRQ